MRDNHANIKCPKSQTNKGEVSKDLWIAPRYSLKGPAQERAWENRPGGAPNSSRFLELADIALGVKKPAAKKKHTARRQCTSDWQD